MIETVNKAEEWRARAWRVNKTQPNRAHVVSQLCRASFEVHTGRFTGPEREVPPKEW